jgi:hypothetical protein
MHVLLEKNNFLIFGTKGTSTNVIYLDVISVSGAH